MPGMLLQMGPSGKASQKRNSTRIEGPAYKAMSSFRTVGLLASPTVFRVGSREQNLSISGPQHPTGMFCSVQRYVHFVLIANF